MTQHEEAGGGNPFAAPAPTAGTGYPDKHGTWPAFGQLPAQPAQYGPPAPYGQPPQYGPPPHYGPPPYGQPPQYGPPPYGPGSAVLRTNGMAIASLVLGILWIYWVGSVLALVFGYIAKRQIRERAESGGGLATAGIVLGWIGVGVFILVVALGAAGAFDSGTTF